MNRDYFENLFVLEMANNHWGDVERGLRIVNEFAQVVRFNDVRAAIKLQVRDVDQFVHRDWRQRSDIRYIKKTLDTKLSRNDLERLIDAIRRNGCIPAATPFDEASVRLCNDLGMDFIKIASSDINDWFLMEEIAKTRKPVSFSTGGSGLKSIDDVATFFGRRGIPLAINHCVSIYPSEDHELELDQIDFFRDRYPDHVVGLSTHEQRSWDTSMHIAYAKGARTFERHIDIDIDAGGISVSPYCSRPEQIDTWFKAFHKAKEMCGGSKHERRTLPEKEVRYLDSLVRGIYARRDLEPGHVLSPDDVYLAIPLQHGQLSPREFMTGRLVTQAVRQDEPVRIEQIDSPYGEIPGLRALINDRGVEPNAPSAPSTSEAQNGRAGDPTGG